MAAKLALPTPEAFVPSHYGKQQRHRSEQSYLTSWKRLGHSTDSWHDGALSEWTPYLLEVPVLLMDGRTFLGAVLKNHLLTPDVEAQVPWAAKVDVLPAGVLQVLGERERLLAQLEGDSLQSWR